MEGEYLHQFGKKGDGKGELETPHCLSVDKVGNLIVCEADNNRIQVFESNGKFVTQFGRKGTKVGEFNTPVSTAILSDGRIVVSDFNNHRIQIFE